MTATSGSNTSHVTIVLGQTCSLSSVHSPDVRSLRTVCATRGGLGRAGSMGGSKSSPRLGGGFKPAYGPSRRDTDGSGTIVVPLPDSKIATYTLVPSGLMVMARGYFPAIWTISGGCDR